MQFTLYHKIAFGNETQTKVNRKFDKRNSSKNFEEKCATETSYQKSIGWHFLQIQLKLMNNFKIIQRDIECKYEKFE